MTRTIQHPQGPTVDIWVYNTDTVAIARGHICSWATAEDNLKVTEDPYSDGPISGTATVPIVGVVACTAATQAYAGIAQRNIPAGEWGQIRTYGAGVMETAAATYVHLASISGTATAGRGDNSAVAGTDAIACAIGAQTSLGAGTLAKVFIDVPGSYTVTAANVMRPMGIWV